MIKCPYCKNEAKLATGEIIYPRRPDLASKKFWHCGPCDAYVGCHPATRFTQFKDDQPLGRLANGELRTAKMKAHAAFDPLWKDGYFRTRTGAYNWLANTLKLSADDCHIGMFDVEMCMRVVDACKELRK